MITYGQLRSGIRYARRKAVRRKERPALEEIRVKTDIFKAIFGPDAGRIEYVDGCEVIPDEEQNDSPMENVFGCHVGDYNAYDLGRCERIHIGSWAVSHVCCEAAGWTDGWEMVYEPTLVVRTLMPKRSQS